MGLVGLFLHQVTFAAGRTALDRGYEGCAACKGPCRFPATAQSEKGPPTAKESQSPRQSQKVAPLSRGWSGRPLRQDALLCLPQKGHHCITNPPNPFAGLFQQASFRVSRNGLLLATAPWRRTSTPAQTEAAETPLLKNACLRETNPPNPPNPLLQGRPGGSPLQGPQKTPNRWRCPPNPV